MTPRPSIPNAAARRLFIARHALADDPRPRQAPAGLLALIRRLGFVQVDSINTVARAHDMILFTRNQTYRPAHLKRLLEKDRALFENWTHDAAIVPVEFYPYWRVRFGREAGHLAERWSAYRTPGFLASADEVIAHIARDGPVMSREVGDGAKRPNGGWWDWHPSKTALEYLWRTGRLAVAGRNGFQKIYDLAERVIPAGHRDHVPDEAAFVGWACASALDRLGFATSGEIAAFWGLATPPEAAAWCRAELAAGGLVEIEVATAGDGPPRRALARPGIVDEAAAAPAPPDRVRMLSPFDPLIRDRARTERLFGFHYRIEVFIPEAKRRYGYYVFPLLEGDRLIGRIDVRRRRGSGALEVDGLWLEPRVRPSKGRMARIDAELERYRRFTGDAGVVWNVARETVGR